LICAPSNVVADHILALLIKANLKAVRYLSASRENEVNEFDPIYNHYLHIKIKDEYLKS